VTTPSNFIPTIGSPRPSWFARNWKWAVLLGVVVALLLLASFVGGIFLIVETAFQHSGCYTEALTRARSNPEVSEKIGEPLQAGWLAVGSVNQSGASGDADLSVPISGPKGKGTLYLVAKKSAGQWNFEKLQVAVAGETQRIDLLKPEAENTPRENQ
jgi:hypothetical protein